MNWERKYQVFARLYAFFGQRTESLIQDAEIPAPQACEFVRWFHEHIGMKPFLAAPVQTTGMMCASLSHPSSRAGHM
jgi:hypothetical protein